MEKEQLIKDIQATLDKTNNETFNLVCEDFLKKCDEDELLAGLIADHLTALVDRCQSIDVKEAAGVVMAACQFSYRLGQLDKFEVT